MTLRVKRKSKKICACKFSAIFDISTSVSWPNLVKNLILGVEALLLEGFQRLFAERLTPFEGRFFNARWRKVFQRPLVQRGVEVLGANFGEAIAIYDLLMIDHW